MGVATCLVGGKWELITTLVILQANTPPLGSELYKRELSALCSPSFCMLQHRRVEVEREKVRKLAFYRQRKRRKKGQTEYLETTRSKTTSLSKAKGKKDGTETIKSG